MLFPSRETDCCWEPKRVNDGVTMGVNFSLKLTCLQTSFLCHSTHRWWKVPTELPCSVQSLWTSHHSQPTWPVAFNPAIRKFKGLYFKAYILDTRSVTWSDLCHFTQVEQQNQTSPFQSIISKPYKSGFKVTREEGLN